MKAFTVIIGIFILVGGTVGIIDFVQNNPSSDGTYTAASSSTVEYYIQEQEIEPINIKNMDTQTMIFAESALHVLAEDDATGSLTTAVNSSSGTSGISMGKNNTGIPYMYLIFNDSDLYEQVDRIEVSIDRGEVIHEIIPEEQGIILLYGESEMKEEYNSYEVTVYDADHQILYEN